jgi:hypothetical protein
MPGQGSSAAGITWDLTDLFASHDDPRIVATLEECGRRADAFAARYRGTVRWAGSPSAEALLAGVKELEAIQEALGRVAAYAGLLYASDTGRLEFQNLQQRVEEQEPIWPTASSSSSWSGSAWRREPRRACSGSLPSPPTGTTWRHSAASAPTSSRRRRRSSSTRRTTPAGGPSAASLQN